MTTVYDVPAKELIDQIAKKLKKDKNITKPESLKFSKTGVSKENQPSNKDWWHTRCASILRKIYLNDTIGTQRLRNLYGGKKDRGSKPYKNRSGSGSITRKALQQLEGSGYITKIKGRGRKLTSKGRSFLDEVSNEISKEIQDTIPELKKY